MTINAVGLLGLLLLSVAIASEKDPPPTSSEKLKLWRSVKTFVEYDPPAIATQSPALGDRQEHEDGRGKALPPLPPTSSEELKLWRRVKKFVEYDPPAITTQALGDRQEHGGGDLSKSADGEGGVAVPTHLSRVDSDADTAGQHGLEHPGVVVDVPVLECECTEYSTVASSSEYSHVASSSCREVGQVSFNVSVRGLFPGFEYEFEITWTLEGEKLTHIWKSVVMAKADSHTLRQNLVQRGGDFHFGILAWEAYNKGNDPFLIGVTVHDMYPGLTREEALIGIRSFDSIRVPVRLSCMKYVWQSMSQINFDCFDRNTSSHMLAINFADQSRIFHHHPVFNVMPIKPLQVDSRFVIEHTGLKVPSEIDCHNAFTEDIKSAEMKNSKPLEHDYYIAVPSVWMACNNLASYVRSGQKWFIPSFPVIDEEYVELVSVYEMAMHAKGTFTLIELGARWGPWGFRAAAAIQQYNSAVQNVDIFFVEPLPESCAAIWKVAKINDFKQPKFNISVSCELASSEILQKWAETRQFIDVFDMDCQGCEYEIVPNILNILNNKVRRLIIGVHKGGSEGVSELLRNLPGWTIVHQSMVAGGAKNFDCQDTLRGPMKWSAQSRIQDICNLKLFEHNSKHEYGPMINWDGDLILDNPRFLI